MGQLEQLGQLEQEGQLVERYGYIHRVNEKTNRLWCGQPSPKHWEQRFSGDANQITCQGCQQALERDREWQDAYARYIDSDPWKQKSFMALEHNRFYQHGMCQGCFVRQATQVHHVTYPKNCLPGDPEWHRQEKFFMLEPVCDECHKDLHPHLGD